ncbi:hypothetical protein M9Y10_019889 [Tritrichomonas musculus]|uniref:Uncharacterized protein n=1 Tax=Tritrichomonas musculus TaxID=1915356 RepID=A0ABR2HIT5_9EUKA
MSWDQVEAGYYDKNDCDSKFALKSEIPEIPDDYATVDQLEYYVLKSEIPNMSNVRTYHDLTYNLGEITQLNITYDDTNNHYNIMPFTEGAHITFNVEFKNGDIVHFDIIFRSDKTMNNNHIMGYNKDGSIGSYSSYDYRIMWNSADGGLRVSCYRNITTVKCYHNMSATTSAYQDSLVLKSMYELKISTLEARIIEMEDNQWKIFYSGFMDCYDQYVDDLMSINYDTSTNVLSISWEYGTDAYEVLIVFNDLNDRKHYIRMITGTKIALLDEIYGSDHLKVTKFNETNSTYDFNVGIRLNTIVDRTVYIKQVKWIES